MNINEVMKRVYELFPEAIIDEEDNGEIIISTGIREISGGWLESVVDVNA